MTGFCTVYVTAASEDEALKIARAAVADRLAACANVLGPVTSVYEWQGEPQEDREVALVLKTRSSLFDKLAARIKSLHSYETPCIVAWPIEAGTDDYLGWVGDRTADS